MALLRENYSDFEPTLATEKLSERHQISIGRSMNSRQSWVIFAWQDFITLSKSLTFQYDWMLYLVEPTEENTRIAGEKIKVYDYPDGTLAFKERAHLRLQDRLVGGLRFFRRGPPYLPQVSTDQPLKLTADG